MTERPLTPDEAERAGDLIIQIVTSFPVLVSAISDEDAALIRAGIDAAERQLYSRDALLPILAAHSIGDDPKLATKHANIQIVRAVLAFRDAVRQGVAAEQAAKDDRDAFDANRRQLMALVGRGYAVLTCPRCKQERIYRGGTTEAEQKRAS